MQASPRFQKERISLWRLKVPDAGVLQILQTIRYQQPHNEITQISLYHNILFRQQKISPPLKTVRQLLGRVLQQDQPEKVRKVHGIATTCSKQINGHMRDE